MNQQLRELQEAIVKARCAQGASWRCRCDDVQAELLHVSLSGMSAGPEKDKLLAIPTGLTIPKEDVDLLIKAGHDAITGSREIGKFLAAYPPAPIAGPSSSKAQRHIAQR